LHGGWAAPSTRRCQDHARYLSAVHASRVARTLPSRRDCRA
jgi:hypothetical protein